MPFWKYLLLFAAVLIGGGLALLIRRQHQQVLRFVLSFSGAYILGITVVHLLPELFQHHPKFGIGLWILLGFLAQLLLEKLSQGIEHGHIHIPHRASARFAVSIMLGLSIHALLEGMPLGEHGADLHQHGHMHSARHLYFGILLHKFPAAFALGLLLAHSGFRVRTVWLCLLIFSLMSPIGAAIFHVFEISETLHTIIIAFVAGSFLHISTTILFELGDAQHRISWPRLLAVLIGSGLALMTLLL